MHDIDVCERSKKAPIIAYANFSSPNQKESDFVFKLVICINKSKCVSFYVLALKA